jgi:MFS family permease
MGSSVLKQKIFYGWIIVLAGFMLTASYGIFYTLTVFFNTIKAEFGWSATLISSIHSFHLFIYILSGLIISRLTERYEPRLIFLFCAILSGLGISLLSQVKTIEQFYLFYALATIGLGGAWAPPLAITQRWFNYKKGLALGIVGAGVSLGTLIQAPLANFLINSYGWRNAYLIEGIITFLILFIGAALIVSDPAKVGLKPLGEEKESGDHHSSNFKNVELDWTLKEAVKTRALLSIGLAYFFTLLPVHMLGVHFVPYAVGTGISKTAAVAAWGVLNGAGIFGRVFIGDIGQRFGWKNTLIGCCLICALLTLWLITLNKLWMLYLFSFIYGLCYGGRTTQIFGLLGYCFGNTKSMPTIIAFTHGVSLIGGVIGPIIGGSIHDYTGNYTPAFVICALSWGLAAVSSIAVTKPAKPVSPYLPKP